VLLREGQPEQPHLRHAAHHVVREGLGGIVVGGDRGHDLAGERLHGLAQRLLLLGEPGVEHSVPPGRSGAQASGASRPHRPTPPLGWSDGRTGSRLVLTALVERFRALLNELAKFGTVGFVSLLIDLAVFNLMLQVLPDKPLTAKVVSTAVSATNAFVLNRHWSFRHRERTTLRREYGLFLVLNSVGLAISLLCLSISHYVLGLPVGAGQQPGRQRGRAGPRDGVPLLVLPEVRLGRAGGGRRGGRGRRCRRDRGARGRPGRHPAPLTALVDGQPVDRGGDRRVGRLGERAEARHDLPRRATAATSRSSTARRLPPLGVRGPASAPRTAAARDSAVHVELLQHREGDAVRRRAELGDLLRVPRLLTRNWLQGTPTTTTSARRVQRLEAGVLRRSRTWTRR
jgi:putative flippase GtrA